MLGARHRIEKNMRDDTPVGMLDGRRAELQMHPLTVVAWLATGVYGMLVAGFVIAGIAAKTSPESAMMFALAGVSAIPLALMLAIMGTASGRRSLTGRWICIVLGSVSFVALILLITS
jgi:hypothetical protein